MDDVEVPKYFICPISLQIMKDPVTAITGITYERDSIKHWLLIQGQKATCPVTKQPLSIDSDLTPNHTLHRLIQSWCTPNPSNAIYPNPPLNKCYILNLIRDLWLPKLQLSTLRKLESLAVESEKNRQYMVEASVAKAVVVFIIACYNKGETTGLQEALSILYLIRNSHVKTRLIFTENDKIIDSLTWILGFDVHNHAAMKSHAIIVLKTIVENATSNILERSKLEFFEKIVFVLREGISQQGIRAALHVMLGACPWPRNLTMMVEAGAVFELVELELGSPEKRATEMILGVLFHLCSCAEGRAQLLSHAAGIAVVTKRILRVSPAADDRALLILTLICRFCGTSCVIQEMLSVGTVTRLYMVLQVECASYLKDKAREILRRHSDVWKNSPCVDVTVQTR